MNSLALELAAEYSSRGLIRVPGEGSQRVSPKALWQLERAGYAFRIARGLYAVPDERGLVNALTFRSADQRLASWFTHWLERPSNRHHLARGISWEQPRFLGLAIEKWTDLRWPGPPVVFPIERSAQKLGRIHHRERIMIYDEAEKPAELQIGSSKEIPVPSRHDVGRLLAVSSEPRLREAGLDLLGPRPWDAKLRAIVERTDPILPFPDPKTKLPRGPPFRYRTYAPISWVRNQLQYNIQLFLGEDRTHAKRNRRR